VCKVEDLWLLFFLLRKIIGKRSVGPSYSKRLKISIKHSLCFRKK